MTENEYSYLFFMYHRLGYDEAMSFEEFVNRYGNALLDNQKGDNND